VNDVPAYPRRFQWCERAEVLEQGVGRMLARLELGLAGFRTWFTTENTLDPPHRLDMDLRDGPFRRLRGRWLFHALDESACKVSVGPNFEQPRAVVLLVLSLGMSGLGRRMVDDFVRLVDGGWF